MAKSKAKKPSYLDNANADSLTAARKHTEVKTTDGWMNLLTGLGVSGYDKKESTFFTGDLRLDETQVRDLMQFNGLARRIITLLTDDMLRQWFTIEGDTQNAVPNYFRKIKGRDGGNAKREIYRALNWSRAYGGSMLVVGAMDGGNFDQPLNEDRITVIEFIHAYQRYRISRASFYSDTAKANYNETERYLVSPPRGTSFYVHESRCILFDGEDVPPETRLINDGWGDSCLQAVYRRLRGIGESYAGCETIIQEFILTFLQITGLANLLAGNQESEVQKRLNILDLSKHIMNTVILDKDEKVERVSASVAGLADLMGKLIQAVSSETGYPVRKLFGEINVGSGLSNDRSEETRDYYDRVKAEQESRLIGPLERISLLIMKSKQGPTQGQEIKDKNSTTWKIVFPSLWQPTEKEIVETRGKQAEIDERYYNMTVLASEEIRKSRFGGDNYSIETTIDPNLDLESIKDPDNPEGNEDLLNIKPDIKTGNDDQ